MSVEHHVVYERPRLEIDEKLGFVLAVVAGILLSVAVGGWIILLSNVMKLQTAFDANEVQRFAELGQIQAKVVLVQSSIDDLTARYKRVESATNQNTDHISGIIHKLNELKNDVEGSKGQDQERPSGNKPGSR
jgi:hypothetical protein